MLQDGGKESVAVVLLRASGEELAAKQEQVKENAAQAEKAAAAEKKPEALADFDKALAAIRAASVTPGLVSVAEFKSRPAAK